MRIYVLVSGLGYNNKLGGGGFLAVSLTAKEKNYYVYICAKMHLIFLQIRNELQHFCGGDVVRYMIMRRSSKKKKENGITLL